MKVGKNDPRSSMSRSVKGKLQEGSEAYKSARLPACCPYGSDERNGIWVFGKQKAKQGLSFAQACRDFRRMEGL